MDSPQTPLNPQPIGVKANEDKRLEKFYRARVTERNDIAADLWTVKIKAEGEFKFAPGQYATLGVDGPDKRSERAYSIVSSPYEDELEFFFELVPARRAYAETLQAPGRRRIINAKNPQGTVHAGYQKWTPQSSSGCDRHRSGSIRELRAHSL